MTIDVLRRRFSGALSPPDRNLASLPKIQTLLKHSWYKLIFIAANFNGFHTNYVKFEKWPNKSIICDQFKSQKDAA